MRKEDSQSQIYLKSFYLDGNKKIQHKAYGINFSQYIQVVLLVMARVELACDGRMAGVCYEIVVRQVNLLWWSFSRVI
ncbi:hypothetical protein ABKV19_017474 [Rosa sericea]